MAYSDVVLFIIMVVIIGALVVIMNYVYDIISGEMATALNFAPSTAWLNTWGGVWVWLDYVFLISYISFLVGSIILSFFVKSHPVFFIFFMIAAISLTFVAWIFKNIFDEFILAISGLQAYYDKYYWVKFFITNLDTVVLISSVVIAVFQYSKDNILQRFGYGY